MAFKIVPNDPEAVAQRRPRLVNTPHLNFIRRLSCVICGAKPAQAAHIRTAYLLFRKRGVGFGEKPDDRWTIPLCDIVKADGKPGCHAAQHAMEELVFWHQHQIDPFPLALALYAASVSDDEEWAEAIVGEHRMRAMLGGA